MRSIYFKIFATAALIATAAPASACWLEGMSGGGRFSPFAGAMHGPMMSQTEQDQLAEISMNPSQTEQMSLAATSDASTGNKTAEAAATSEQSTKDMKVYDAANVAARKAVQPPKDVKVSKN